MSTPRRTSAIPCRARERPVERIRKCLLLARAVGRMATRLDTRPPEPVHEAPHRQALPDALCRVFLTPRIEYGDPLGHQEGGQWNVRCDGYIARGGVLRDIAVGHVRPAVHPHGQQVPAPWRKLEALIGHKDGREREAFGRPEADVLHVSRGGVGVDPECYAHRASPSSGEWRDWQQAHMGEDSLGGSTGTGPALGAPSSPSHDAL
jgi:hypothetical protein